MPSWWLALNAIAVMDAAKKMLPSDSSADPGLVLRYEVWKLAQQFVASDTTKNHCQAFFASMLIGGEEKLVESLDRNQLSAQCREAHTSEYISAVLVRCSKNLGNSTPPND